MEDLKKLRDKTIIIRTFEEVTGKKLYEIKQILCDMNCSEKDLYNRLLAKSNLRANITLKIYIFVQTSMFIFVKRQKEPKNVSKGGFRFPLLIIPLNGGSVNNILLEKDIIG